jgi:hypothetical protein
MQRYANAHRDRSRLVCNARNRRPLQTRRIIDVQDLLQGCASTARWALSRSLALFIGAGIDYEAQTAGKNQIVFAKFSSQALPMDEQRIQLTMQGVAAMRNSVLVAQEA